MLFDILRKKGYGDEYVQRYQVASVCWLLLLHSEQCMACLVHGCSTLQATPTKPLSLHSDHVSICPVYCADGDPLLPAEAASHRAHCGLSLLRWPHALAAGRLAACSGLPGL